MVDNIFKVEFTWKNQKPEILYMQGPLKTVIHLVTIHTEILKDRHLVSITLTVIEIWKVGANGEESISIEPVES